jgi:hypothetical protein
MKWKLINNGATKWGPICAHAIVMDRPSLGDEDGSQQWLQKFTFLAVDEEIDMQAIVDHDGVS